MHNGTRKYSKKATKIINVTNKTFCIYEESTGNIKRFLPEDKDEIKRELVATIAKKELAINDTNDSNDSSIIYFVVTNKTLELLRETGYEFDNLAIITHEAIGRHGVKISHLAWSKDPNIRIEFHDYQFKKSAG